jgi:cytosine/adenosine deaminase-related metal-dependent hydrolase
MIYQADWVLPGDTPPIRDGWIQVEGGRITATGSGENLPGNIPESDLRRFDGCALLPGLINAHCHLELTGLHGQLERGNPFPEWVGQLRARSADFRESDYRAAADAGVRKLLAGGATTVVDVGNTGAALAALADSPLRAFAFAETLGLDPALAAARFTAAMHLVENNPATDRFKPGLAPHAAYSCSERLLGLVKNHQVTHSLPYTIHAAESREEAEVFATDSGPLADFCRRIHADAPRHQGTSPIHWLESKGLLPDGALIVHGNTLDDADMEILARRKATVVHCPSSHAFFGHPRFPYEKLRAHGIPVCFGTDSLASGDSLSMREQMRLFSENYPEVSLEEIVKMATAVAAEALGMHDTGVLKPGCKADFLAVKTGTGAPDKGALFGSGSSVLEAFIDGERAGDVAAFRGL